FVAVVIGAALATQWLCSRLWRLPRFDPLSALISGIGLATLLRTNGILLATLAAAVAITSKFVLRFRGKHLYNPTNLALVVMLVPLVPLLDRLFPGPRYQWQARLVPALATS